MQDGIMKAYLAFLSVRKVAFLAAAIFCSASLGYAQNPTALLRIDRSDAGASVTITDPGNHLWVIQSSTNLRGWTQAGVWKIYNGSFHGTFNQGTAIPNLFFRGLLGPLGGDLP